MEIPVIDIQRPETLRQLDAACRDWGFFQITNHGVSDELIAAMHREMRELFSLTLEAKHQIERTATNSWGFYDRELTKNTRDWKQIFESSDPMERVSREPQCGRLRRPRRGSADLALPDRCVLIQRTGATSFVTSTLPCS